MTVKCLTNTQKSHIVQDFRDGFYDIPSLCYQYEISRRTIIRVLEEAGVDPKIRRRARKQVPLANLELADIPQPTIKEPWFHRIINKFCQVFNPEQYGHSTFN